MLTTALKWLLCGLKPNETRTAQQPELPRTQTHAGRHRYVYICLYARICVSLCSPRWLQRFSILWFTDEVRSTVSKFHANAQSHLDIETPTPTLLQLRGNRVSCSCHCLAFCTSPNNSSETKNATVMWVDQLADTLHCLGKGKLISNSNINYLFATLAKQNYRNAKQYDIDTNKQHVESNIDMINIYQVLKYFSNIIVTPLTTCCTYRVS